MDRYYGCTGLGPKDGGSMSAPGRERLYENWEHFLAARGGERRSILPLGEGYEDDLGLFCPGEPNARGAVKASLFYGRDTGDVYAVQHVENVGSPVVLLGAAGRGQDESELLDWLRDDRVGFGGQPLSTFVARVATFANEPRICDTLAEFAQWRGFAEADAEMVEGVHSADVYDDIAKVPGAHVQVFYVSGTGDVYAHDARGDGGYALLGRIDPNRRVVFFEWLGPLEDRPLSWFVACLEVFNGTGSPALGIPLCWQDGKHYWMSELSGTGSGNLRAGIAEDVHGLVVREVCLQCGCNRVSSVGSVRYDGLDRAVLPVAVMLGPKIVVTGGQGAEMAPNARETFLRLVSELFPQRAIVTLDDEDVSELTCEECGLWVGDPGNPQIAHVSITHREREEWTCEAEVPSGVAL